MNIAAKCFIRETWSREIAKEMLCPISTSVGDNGEKMFMRTNGTVGWLEKDENRRPRGFYSLFKSI